MSAREVVVLPTCCLVAATKMGRVFLVLVLVDVVLSPRITAEELIFGELLRRSSTWMLDSMMAGCWIDCGLRRRGRGVWCGVASC